MITVLLPRTFIFIISNDWRQFFSLWEHWGSYLVKVKPSHHDRRWRVNLSDWIHDCSSPGSRTVPAPGSTPWCGSRLSHWYCLHFVQTSDERIWKTSLKAKSLFLNPIIYFRAKKEGKRVYKPDSLLWLKFTCDQFSTRTTTPRKLLAQYPEVMLAYATPVEDCAPIKRPLPA